MDSPPRAKDQQADAKSASAPTRAEPLGFFSGATPDEPKPEPAGSTSVGNPLDKVNEFLRVATNYGASDIHLKAGLPPVFRINGNLATIKDLARVSGPDIRAIAHEMMNEKQRERFLETMEMDMAYSVKGLGRFRVNCSQQRGTTSICFRVIPFSVANFESLHLPKVIERIAMERRGLVLVTGSTGSGKSTTLAAMVDYINNHRTCHIVTVEDPIEFVFQDKMSIITQRELGFDSLAFPIALKAALRQDPDVILVGEMRDIDTVETALMAAETGHLVLSTLHTLDVVETVNRVISLFPFYQQDQVRFQLAGLLKAVVSMRLLPMADGKGRVPALEIMISNSRIRDCIKDKNKTPEILDAMLQGGASYGMQIFDQSLMNLFKSRLITYEEAMANATNPGDFALKAKGVSSAASESGWNEEDTLIRKAAPKGMEIERFSK